MSFSEEKEAEYGKNRYGNEVCYREQSKSLESFRDQVINSNNSLSHALTRSTVSLLRIPLNVTSGVKIVRDIVIILVVGKSTDTLIQPIVLQKRALFDVVHIIVPSVVLESINERGLTPSVNVVYVEEWVEFAAGGEAPILRIHAG